MVLATNPLATTAFCAPYVAVDAGTLDHAGRPGRRATPRPAGRQRGVRACTCVVRSAFVVAVLAGPARAGGKGVEGAVNLNTAPAEVLALLPGVGPAKAQSILAYRKRHPFRTVDELVRIKGIGRKMVRRLRAHLAVGGPTTAMAPSEGARPPPPPPPPPKRPPPPLCARPPLHPTRPAPRVTMARHGACPPPP